MATVEVGRRYETVVDQNDHVYIVLCIAQHAFDCEQDIVCFQSIADSGQTFYLSVFEFKRHMCCID